MSRKSGGTERAGLPSPKVQHNLFEAPGPGGRPRMDQERKTGERAADERAVSHPVRSGAAALEYLKNGGPLIKGNVASENLDQWFKDILHVFIVKNIEHVSR